MLPINKMTEYLVSVLGRRRAPDNRRWFLQSLTIFCKQDSRPLSHCRKYLQVLCKGCAHKSRHNALGSIFQIPDSLSVNDIQKEKASLC